MTLYLVTNIVETDFENLDVPLTEVYGMFSDEEKANEVKDKLNQIFKSLDEKYMEASVIPLELDKVTDDYEWWDIARKEMEYEGDWLSS